MPQGGFSSGCTDDLFVLKSERRRSKPHPYIEITTSSDLFKDIPIAANALGTLGAVCLAVKVPVVIKSTRSHIYLSTISSAITPIHHQLSLAPYRRFPTLNKKSHYVSEIVRAGSTPSAPSALPSPPPVKVVSAHLIFNMPITKPKGVPFEWLEEHVLPMLGDAPRQDLAAKLDELKQVPSSVSCHGF